MLLLFYSGKLAWSPYLHPGKVTSCILTPSTLSSTLLYFASRDNVDKREALENLDLILLCIDEIVDGG